AFYTFLADDGWAIASHIALSTLMALFPFLIVLTSLAGFFGSKELADQAAGLLLQVWPKQVADALSGEIHDVLTTTRGDVLTIRWWWKATINFSISRATASPSWPWSSPSLSCTPGFPRGGAASCRSCPASSSPWWRR